MLLFAALIAALPATAAPVAPLPFSGPAHGSLDLLRTREGGPRIYVQATFPDGSRGLFLVDTGANISILSKRTAGRLGLEVDADYGSVIGLGGLSRMDRSVLPTLKLGDMTVFDVEVAIGVPGMAERAGAMELDGLLGNNVWSRFLVEIDYPADRMVLHRPGSVRPKRSAAQMVFDGSHLFTALEIRTVNDPDTLHSVVLRVDTGAGELSLCGEVAEAFNATWSEGLEPVLGLGASETLPPFRNLQTTRRLKLEEVRLAGRSLDGITSARWMNFAGERRCPDDMRGLIGHQLLSQHRVLFDFQNHRLELRKSRRKPRQLNGHAVILEQLQAQSPSPEQAYYRAQLALQLDDFEAAHADLEIAASFPPTHEKAVVLAARVARFQGDLETARDRLLELDPGQLVDNDAIVAMVNAELFAGRDRQAVEIASEAVRMRPHSGWASVALADALLSTGDLEGAQNAILRAVELESFPDAHLLRRARIALASDDRNGAMADIRRLLHLYPMGGEFLWFYALLVDGTSDQQTFRSDLDHAMARLHADRLPFDFLVAAHQVIGDDEEALSAMRRGIQRDCDGLDRGAAQDNCLAWYWSLAHHNPDQALARIERALDESGERSDYLDTLAMVHLAREEYDEAVAAARGAARLAPDSVYMIWQAERIGDLSEASR